MRSYWVEGIEFHTEGPAEAAEAFAAWSLRDKPPTEWPTEPLQVRVNQDLLTWVYEVHVDVKAKAIRA